jgi:hypothetical protein
VISDINISIIWSPDGTLILKRVDFPFQSLKKPVALGGTLNIRAAEFWTTARPYWDMETEAPELFASLKGSGLVIFKVSFIFIYPT